MTLPYTWSQANVFVIVFCLITRPVNQAHLKRLRRSPTPSWIRWPHGGGKSTVSVEVSVCKPTAKEKMLLQKALDSQEAFLCHLILLIPKQKGQSGVCRNLQVGRVASELHWKGWGQQVGWKLAPLSLHHQLPTDVQGKTWSHVFICSSDKK